MRKKKLPNFKHLCFYKFIIDCFLYDRGLDHERIKAGELTP